MNELVNLIPFGIIIFLIIVCMVYASNFFKHMRHERYLKSFVDYASVLDYHMQKAYDIIYKDRILVYSLEAMRIKDSDFNAIIQDFARLVIKFLGPTLHQEFLYLYGDQDTFMFNMVEFFNTRYEEDEVRKSSISEISQKEDSPSEMVNYVPAN